MVRVGSGLSIARQEAKGQDIWGACSTATPSKHRLAELIDGATRPSLPALLGTLAVSLACLLACIACITPELLMHGGFDYLAVDETDEYVRLTQELWNFRLSPPEEFTVALLGSSNLREAITHADELESTLEARMGQPVRILDFNAAGLRICEMFIAAGVFNRDTRGIVVLPMAPVEVSFNPEEIKGFITHPRVAIMTPAYEEALHAIAQPMPRRTGNFFLDNYHFFVGRTAAFTNLVRGPVVIKRHMTEDWRPQTDIETQLAVEWHRTVLNRVEHYLDANLELYRRLVAWLRQMPHLEVVLLESVRNPAADREVLNTPKLQQAFAEYQRAVTQLADEEGAVYWDLADSADLAPEDFIDTSHINNHAARKRFSAALADRLAELGQTSERLKENSS